MKQTTLKELLKPPFMNGGGRITDANGRILLDINVMAFTGIDCDFLARLMDLENLVLQALNEKWEREHGEPLKWIPCDSHIIGSCFMCEKCKATSKKLSKCCPHCGKQLDPPGKGGLRGVSEC